MKSRVPHNFLLFASNFSLDSMIKAVAHWAFIVFKNDNKTFGNFARDQFFTISNKKSKISGKTRIVQTWLIDLIYTLACLKNTGSRNITKQETLYLIDMFIKQLL